MPEPTPPVVVTSALVQDAAQPVLKRVGELAAEAVTNAELSTGQLTGVYCIGAGSDMPAIAQAITEQVGQVPAALMQPGFAAVLGAAEAGNGQPGITQTTMAPVEALPPWRRPFAMIPPAVASLALYAHFLVAADFYGGTPSNKSVHYWVNVTWGELTLAALFTLITCLSAGSLFGVALQHTQQHERQPPGPGMTVERIAAGIALAAGTAMAIAGLYAVTAAVYLGQPISSPLRWALLPSLPIALSAAAAAWLATRRRVLPPRQGWDAFLAFPNSSVITTAVGVVLVATWWQGPIPALLNGWSRQAAGLGGLLIGIGITCALVRRPVARIALSVPLALFGMIIAGSGAIEFLVVMYAVAVTVWWGRRVWQLLRTPGPARHAT